MVGADSKASQKVFKKSQQLAPDMAFMGVTEEEAGSGGKVMAFAIVPNSLIETGFKADEWVRATLAGVGGRGGGKPGSAQGQAQSCSDVSEIISASNKFASEKIGATV
mmetsp:Transcript_10927/g.12661  ORF Transcript_10927/g.12661 Transcript_10927/m.12661 type:complete len:108 (-) Transcript_10927:46-369(-)